MDNPNEILMKFYQARGIEDSDLKAKFEALQPLVKVPGLSREPTLYELEKQYLVDQGFESFK